MRLLTRKGSQCGTPETIGEVPEGETKRKLSLSPTVEKEFRHP